MENNEVRMPCHVTIIMDGNGRWAKKQGKLRLFGHNVGVESVRECCEYAVENGIRYLSLFAFSEENWGRPKAEVEGLMALMVKSVLAERPTFMKQNVRFRVIGHRESLPEDVLKNIELAENETSGNTGLNLIVMLSYSGKWDIVQAARRLAKATLEAGHEIDIDEAVFSSYLSTEGIPDPDLMIRTSGEQRLSNYMLWQCAYTEFYFSPVLWPDFRKKDLDLAIRSFNSRERRYGKTE
ncbi:MAG: di-trans,poly-cis-decaprenylcistransferase [Bacteroidales bacterium]|nr:di-trans,poly-cis-decaprenylcistransferase [Candidatus Cacconaster merdequi]